ncbi:MAG: cation:proton antiporter [Planctomycetota bacterium]|nr:cation:proton antiporter [Planctomycetota bacterium]
MHEYHLIGQHLDLSLFGAVQHDSHAFLQTLTVVLCAAAITTFVFQKLRQPVVLGYLLAGVVVGPHTSFPVSADGDIVHTLSELGVILLMFSLGLEFSLAKLFKVGPTAGLIGVFQCSVMIWLGYLIGRAFGWTQLESIYCGSIIAISSTTIVVKAFEEQKVRGDFTQLVFGILIIQDLIGIVLITILTTLSTGEELSLEEIADTAGKLSTFLVVLIVVGLIIIPRTIRTIVRLHSAETTLVASIGIAFGISYLAYWFNYSVALGAFIAGSLIAESGVEIKIERLVQPVRDMFAAIFFVSVGMLIDPVQIYDHWPAAIVIFLAVVICQTIAVTSGAFLTGQSIQTSVKAGMSLAQIGEFSFIIAAVGTKTGAIGAFLYPIAVAVSAATTLTTPFLIRLAEPAANFVDRKLPRPLQTFVALYGSWVEQLRSGPAGGSERSGIRRAIRWMALDAVIVATIIIGASVNKDYLGSWIESNFGLSSTLTKFAIVLLAVVISAPFWIGMIRVARFLGLEMSNRVFPVANPDKLDSANASRRLFVVALQLAIVILVGTPLMAITQPFIPPLQGAVVLVLLLSLLTVSFWRRATNLQGHARAAAIVLAEALAQSTKDGRATAYNESTEQISAMMMGFGATKRVIIPMGSEVAGKTLAEINLRGLTGATILAILRNGETLTVPAGQDVLQGGDVLALAGSSEATSLAESLLLGHQPREVFEAV